MDDDSSSSEDEDDPPRQRQKRKYKAVYSVSDRTSSLFYKKYLCEEAVENGIKEEGSFLGKNFRRRFCVPYCLFQDICRDIMLEGFYKHGKSDASGSETVQIELLVLGSLRIAGSGCTFDAIEKLKRPIGSSSITSSAHGAIECFHSTWISRKQKTKSRIS